MTGHTAAPLRPAFRVVLAAAAFAPLSAAQTVDELRQQLRDDIGVRRQTAFVAGFVDLSESPQLSAASLRVPGEPDVDIETYKAPWRDLVSVFGIGNLRVEAGLGYFLARARLEDLFEGALPGAETALATRWEGVSGYFGIGPRVPIGADLYLTPLVDVSLSYLENHARYGGPGAPVSAALLDGIVFNWHATTLAAGGALLLEHEVRLAEETTLTSLARYDVRWFDTVHATDAAQTSGAELQRMTLRTDLGAPVGLELLDGPLRWNTHFAYTRFLGSDDDGIGFADYFELGAGLASPIPLPGGRSTALQLAGAVMYGEDVRGWTLGLSLAF